MVLSNPVNPADTFVLAPVGAFEPINEKVNGRMIERRPTLATIEDYLYATNSSAMPGGAGMPGMAMGSMGGGFMRGMAYANIKLEKDGLVGFPGTGLVALRCSVGWQPQEILGDLPEVKVGDKVFAVNRDDQPTSSTITKRTAYEVTEINAQAGLASADGKSPVDMLTGLIKVVGTAPQPGAGMLLCDEKGVPIGVVVISSRSPTEGAATGAPAPPSPKSYAYVLPMQRVFDLSLPASGKEPANIDVRGYLPGSGKAATSRADQSQADQEFLSLLQADIEIYRSLEGEKRDEQKTVIAKKLEAHFEAQQARRSQEVADLALRLEQLKATTQKRGELKSELMQKQLEKILQP